MVRRLGAELRMRKESKNSHAVTDRNNDHAAARELSSVVEGTSGVTAAESAAMDPNHYRCAPPHFRGPPDVEIQTVLAHVLGIVCINTHRGRFRLHTGSSEVRRGALALPGGNGP